MKRLLIVLTMLTGCCYLTAMRQEDVNVSQTPALQESDPDLDDFVIVEPSNEMVNNWLQEAMQEKIVVDNALENAPLFTQQDMTSWQSFKNTLANIPQGLGYVGRVLGVLNTSRWYLESTLTVILQEEENKLTNVEKASFKAIRVKVKEVIDLYEGRLLKIQQMPAGQKKIDEIGLLTGEFLKDMQFLLKLQEPTSPFGVLSPDAHLILMLTYLKDVRVIQQSTDKVTDIFRIWAELVTDFSAELLNDRKIMIEGVEKVRNPHANTDALVAVRSRGVISQAERDEFLPLRRKKNIEKQRELFEKLVTSDQPVAPVNNQTGIRIGLVMSGGGYRAMTLASGYLEALDQLGILDAASHLSCLSGSTWFLSAWIQSGKSIAEFNKDLASRIAYMQVDYLALNAMNDPVRKKALHFDIMLPKFAFNQPIGSVDIFGWLLSQAVLEGKYNLGVSDQWRLVKNGAYPLPIYTTVSMHNASTDDKPVYRYNWYEVNPIEFENVELGLSIPVWSLGREFKEGRSLRTKGLPTYPFEQSFGYMLATFGSAYTIDFLKEGSQFVGGALGWILSGIQKVKTIKRLWPAQSNNPWLGMASQPAWVRQKPLLTFVDAGIDFNLPVPPLLKKERGLDLIIIGDSSGNIEKTVVINNHAYPAEFGKFLLYLHDVRFDATITNYNIADMLYQPYSGDDRAPFLVYRPIDGIYSLPWLIYINYQKNPDLITKALAGDDKQLKELAQKIEHFDPVNCEMNGFCATFNFKYSSDQFEQLKSMGQFNILAYKENIIEALERQFALKSARISCIGCMTMGAYKGDMKMVDSYVQKGFDINARTEGVPGTYADDAITALHAAVLMNNPEIGKYLLDHGAGINQLSSAGVSPLEVAIRAGHIGMVEFLLTYNPTISQQAIEDAAHNPVMKATLLNEVKRRQIMSGVMGPQTKAVIEENLDPAVAQLRRLEARELERIRLQLLDRDNDAAQTVAEPVELAPVINNLANRLQALATQLGRAGARAVAEDENAATKRN